MSRRRVLMSVLVIVLVAWLGSGWVYARHFGYFHENSCSTGWENATAVLLGPISWIETDPGWGACIVPLRVG